MNRTIRDVLLFGAGFAAGAYVMHTVFRTKYRSTPMHKLMMCATTTARRKLIWIP